MRDSTAKLASAQHDLVRVVVACGLLLFLGVLNASNAQASFEQVKAFGEDNVELYRGTGTAINMTGAGGVPAGTVYIVAKNSGSVARYSPQGEFREAWGFSVANSEPEYQRCGPDGEAAHPTCASVPNKAGGNESVGGLGRCDAQPGGICTPLGIAVDQATGNVYVFNEARKAGVVQVFNADGSQRLGGFGEFGNRGKFPEPAESIEEGPEKFHIAVVDGSALTVDESGRVYVPDLEAAGATPGGGQETRVMIFEPETPGNYERYVYAGRNRDIRSRQWGPITSDDAGNIYVADDNSIYQYSAPSFAPACKYDLPTGGITAMTVDSVTGELFYFTSKKRNIHRLVCEGGVYVDTESIAVSPKPEARMSGFAFNPGISFDGTRPTGILYGLVPSYVTADNREVGRALIFSPGAVLRPIIESQDAAEVGISGAALHAVVNPNGAATRYVFQYISDAAYEANAPGERFAGASELPNNPGQLQSGIVGIPVTVAVAGLQPDTQYHFRVVAENCTEGQEAALCTTVGKEDTFRTFGADASGTPDHRAYELVSPAQKYGGQVYPASTRVFTTSCVECKPGVVGVKFPRITSPDGERVAYEGDPFSFTEGAPNDDAYVSVRTASGWKTTLLNPTQGGSGSGQGVVGYDRNLSEGVLYQGKPSLTATAPSEVNNLYTLPTDAPGSLSTILVAEPPNLGGNVTLGYAGGSSDLEHIFFAADDALTGETADAPAAEFQPNKRNLYEYFEGAIRLVNVLPGNTETVVGSSFGSGGNEFADYSNAISEDGSTVFWSGPSGQVYVRENGVATRELSDHAGHFLTASSDGSKVLLTDGQLIELANEAARVDLTQGQGGFLGIAGQGEDLSRVYFVDTAVLDETPNSEGDSAIAGKPNLYFWNEGSTRFIATLGSKGQISDSGIWANAPVQRTAAASPNGQWLAFTSSAPLMGQDNVGPCGGNGTEIVSGICTDVYLYDAAAGQIVCPSCSPTEEPVLGYSHLAQVNSAAEGALEQQRYITDSGRLFFDSPNRLSPSDTNNGAEDVYEYEPNGIGACNEEGGCVSLVSAGDEFTDSNLLMIDPSGKNAFFTTREQLTLRDKDELFDLYDAREDGGIPSETETIRSECQGEACQAPVSVPNDPTPGSSTFEGAGNVVEKTKKKHKKRHHKRHRKHHKKQQKSKHKRSAGPRAGHYRGGAK